ncbi:hypothetical protein B7463_g4592, partial [Scytalidium lignicola]
MQHQKPISPTAPQNQTPGPIVLLYQTMDQAQPPPEARVRKRRRVGVACSNCRIRKTKCDAAKPTCSTCLASKEVCQYTSIGVPKGANVLINQEYLQSLERRIQSIEGMTPQDQEPKQSSATPSQIPSNTTGTTNTPATTAISEVTQFTIPTTQQPAADVREPESQTRANFVATDPDIFVGGSSGVSFTQLILNAMNGGNSSKVQTEPFSTPRHSESGTGDQNLFSLPSESADLLQLLLDWDMEKVQILLLGSRYLQTSNSPDECWNVLGLAIRIAYGLELHRNPSDEFDYITKEVRKRVWCNLFIFDKLLSMIYGRPSATLATDSNLVPEDLDDDCIEKHRILYPSPRRPSSMSFCIQVAKLYHLLESASRLSDSGNMKRGNLAFTMASLDEEYEEWYQNVPPHLKKIHSSDDDPKEQALILALRANMVRILIHRQSLAFPLHTLSGNNNQEKLASPGGMKSNMFQFSRNICVSSAMEIIKLVGLRYLRTADAVGPSWFNLYYLFNAILVVISHVVDPAYRDDKEALRQLDFAMAMIKRMSTNHDSAQRAYLFLQQLLGYMEKLLNLGETRHSSGGGTIDTSASQANYPHPATGDSHHPSSTPADFDLYALLDMTQNLTDNLGMDLSNSGVEVWPWCEIPQPMSSETFY